MSGKKETPQQYKDRTRRAAEIKKYQPITHYASSSTSGSSSSSSSSSSGSSNYGQSAYESHGIMPSEH